jgi:hypothetical protein
MYTSHPATQILLGVHGNGLTHMVLMKPTRVSAVIELFYPGGFARDYEWTTRALGMRHFSVWNDTCVTSVPPSFRVTEFKLVSALQILYTPE